jgi:phosphoribosylamine--glycine ligase
MKILLIDDGFSLDLAQRLASEGSDVNYYTGNFKESDPFYIQDEASKIHRVSNYMINLNNSDLVMFTSPGWSEDCDFLVGRGYRVFGSGIDAEHLGKDQELSGRILATLGLDITKSRKLKASGAKDSIQTSNKISIIKHIKSKSLSYTPINVEECLSYVEKVAERNPNEEILLVDPMEGIGINISGMFNGTNFSKPLCITFTNKHLLDGDIGILCPTSQIVTALYTSQDLPITNDFRKIEGYLHKIAHHGFFSLDYIINEDGFWVTGCNSYWKSPERIIQSSLIEDKVSDILMSTSEGAITNFNTKEDTWAVGVGLHTAGYPFEGVVKTAESVGIYGVDDAIEDGCKVGFISLIKKEGKYYTYPGRGDVLVISGTGKTIKDARDDAYRAMDYINWQGISYRLDAGLEVERNLDNIIRLGILPKQGEPNEK